MRISMRSNHPRRLVVAVPWPNAHRGVGIGGHDKDLASRSSIKAITKVVVVTLEEAARLGRTGVVGSVSVDDVEQ
jgi:hypothetical protein